MPSVSPEIMIWARETAGLTLEEAAKKLGFQSSRRSTAAEKLANIEGGQKEPSRSQLLKMTEHYRRPLLTFYLSKPPGKEDRGTDFRTISAERSVERDALLDALIREVRARQSMVRSVLESEEEVEPLSFVGSHRIEDGQAEVLATLRELLGVELREYRHQRDPSAAFDLLRTSVEQAEVFVLIKGDLGNYHTALDTTIFRGFSIADEVAPFIVINDQDARSAWSFTLLHEMVHLLLGQTGVGSSSLDNDSERFCNAVAGEYLLPADELKGLDLNGNSNLEVISERIGRFADERNLGRTIVAYNAYVANRIGRETFEKLRSSYYQQWRTQREQERAQSREQEGGPSFYVVRRHRIGKRTLDLVQRMMAADALSTSKAAKILGVKTRQVQSLLGYGS